MPANVVAQILLQGPVYSHLDYLLPQQDYAQARGNDLIGRRAIVPLGKRRVSGFVVGLRPAVEKQSPRSLKPIISLVDEKPLLHAELWHFIKAVANYYLVEPGEVLATALPPTSGYRERRRLRLTEFGKGTTVIDPLERRVLSLLEQRSSVTPTWLAKKADVPQGTIKALLCRGLLEEVSSHGFGQGTQIKKVAAYQLGELPIESARLTLNVQKKLRKVCNILQRGEALTKAEILQQVADAGYALHRAVTLGIITKTTRTVFREAQVEDSGERDTPPLLTPDQTQALAAMLPTLDTHQFQPFLLHGVTGSGKTEVYMRLIARALEKERGVIVLVPEIALTPQLLQRLRSRFGNQICVLHSNLSTGERMDQWRALADGERLVVVGARSAVFAPVKNLGLIVVDEEHDHSYKQDERLTYHGRDMAILRAKLNQATIVLGSATPDVESYHRAGAGDIQLLTMPQRIAGMHIPEANVVDMRQQPAKFGRPPLISAPLIQGLHQTLSKGESAILFLNRRGFTPMLLCPHCGQSPQCNNCSITLTYHRQERALLCHYCGYQRKRDRFCQLCGREPLIDLGMGTEKLAEELETIFPDCRIARMDRDTTRAHAAHGKIIRDLQRGDIDILVGTQMVTKGLDIARVTLVGILAADQGLNFADFRACERTFQLITQVAGRTGRGEQRGYVILQTFNPDHYALHFACSEDYTGFFAKEIVQRQEAHYPPFCKLIRLKFTAVDGKALAKTLSSKPVERKLEALTEELGASLVGPAAAPIKRLYGKFRWHALIKQKLKGAEQQRLRAKEHLFELKHLLEKTDVDMKWDIDPVQFL